jgi:hypothetical protein
MLSVQGDAGSGGFMALIMEQGTASVLGPLCLFTVTLLFTASYTVNLKLTNMRHNDGNCCDSSLFILVHVHRQEDIKAFDCQL